jgi:hypothetical protein
MDADVQRAGEGPCPGSIHACGVSSGKQTAEGPAFDLAVRLTLRSPKALTAIGALAMEPRSPAARKHRARKQQSCNTFPS